jgi:hypothetical protein
MQKTFYIFIVCVIICQVKLSAQSLPVGTPVFEEAYRNAQLLGQIDSTVSFTIRPLFPTALSQHNKSFDPDSILKKNRWSKFDGELIFGKNKGLIKLLPVTWIQQYNSDHPEGFNDGAMIPARGYQTLFSAGFYVHYGSLSIQLKPEVVYAENKSFTGFPGIQPGKTPPVFNSGIDLPERFGNKTYNKFFWGQSSIRITIGPISAGVSNENLWWGPGIRNALLMTNNAPGFEHFTLNTVRPIKTPIGSFEGQMIGGRLEESGYSVSTGNGWRYLNGLALSYQPRWIPGLFLGATRSLFTYGKSIKSFSDYFPVFIPISKAADGGAAEDAKQRDQLASLFMRWLMPEEHGEVYFEYGREDHNWNTRDFLQEASHSSAYILGLKKLIPLKVRKGEFIQINMEVTQMASNSATINRGWTIGWYQHSEVIEGYTNLGQVLGAGIGPCSNLQTINIGWVKGLKTIGVQFERFVHNENYFYDVIKDVRVHWVDLSSAAIASWDYKNLLFNVNAQFVRSINYEWQYVPKLSTPQQYWNESKDVFNFHGQVGVTYRF